MKVCPVNRSVRLPTTSTIWIIKLDPRRSKWGGGAPDVPESWAVVCQDDELGSALTDHLLGLLVAQHILPTLHHQLETGVDGLHGLFLDRQTHP